MDISSFIDVEVKKYRTQALRQKHSKRGLNLDALERAKRRSFQRCTDVIYSIFGYEKYSEMSYWNRIADQRLEAVDDELFSAFRSTY